MKLPARYISWDINARIKADALGIPSADFENQKVDFDELYSGYTELEVPQKTIDAIFAGELVRLPEVKLYANEFVLLKNAENPTHTALARMNPAGEALRPVKTMRKHVFGILPRNLQQTMALDLLLGLLQRLHLGLVLVGVPPAHLEQPAEDEGGDHGGGRPGQARAARLPATCRC